MSILTPSGFAISIYASYLVLFRGETDMGFWLAVIAGTMFTISYLFEERSE